MINGFAVYSPVVGLDEVVLEDVQVVARRKVAPVAPTKKNRFEKRSGPYCPSG